MGYVATENPQLARDTNSKGLVATNATELRKHRLTRSTTKKLVQQQQTSEAKFQQMDDRLDRCETLLNDLVRHLSTLLSRSTDK